MRDAVDAVVLGKHLTSFGPLFTKLSFILINYLQICHNHHLLLLYHKITTEESDIIYLYLFLVIIKQVKKNSKHI